LTTQYIFTYLLLTYLLTYLLKSNPGNPVPATGYSVPKLVRLFLRQITTFEHTLIYSSIFAYFFTLLTAMTI